MEDPSAIYAPGMLRLATAMPDSLGGSLEASESRDEWFDRCYNTHGLFGLEGMKLGSLWSGTTSLWDRVRPHSAQCRPEPELLRFDGVQRIAIRCAWLNRTVYLSPPRGTYDKNAVLSAIDRLRDLWAVNPPKTLAHVRADINGAFAAGRYGTFEMVESKVPVLPEGPYVIGAEHPRHLYLYDPFEQAAAPKHRTPILVSIYDTHRDAALFDVESLRNHYAIAGTFVNLSPGDNLLLFDPTCRILPVQEYAYLLPFIHAASRTGNHWTCDFPHLCLLDLQADANHVYEQIKAQLALIPEIQCYTVQARWLRYYSDGDMSTQHAGVHGLRYAPHPYRGRAPLLYDGPAFVVGLQRMSPATHIPIAILQGRVFVTPDGRFICSDWCQRASKPRPGEGISLITGATAPHTLASWVTSSALVRTDIFSPFQRSSPRDVGSPIRAYRRMKPVASTQKPPLIAPSKWAFAPSTPASRLEKALSTLEGKWTVVYMHQDLSFLSADAPPQYILWTIVLSAAHECTMSLLMEEGYPPLQKLTLSSVFVEAGKPGVAVSISESPQAPLPEEFVPASGGIAGAPHPDVLSAFPSNVYPDKLVAVAVSHNPMSGMQNVLVIMACNQFGEPALTAPPVPLHDWSIAPALMRNAILGIQEAPTVPAEEEEDSGEEEEGDSYEEDHSHSLAWEQEWQQVEEPSK